VIYLRDRFESHTRRFIPLTFHTSSLVRRRVIPLHNQGLEQYLQFYVDAKQGNWAQLLPIAEFTHNSWRNESTGQSPFNLLMGYHPRAEWTAVTSPIPQVTLRLDQIREARDRARTAMIKAQQGWERRKRTAPTFQTGDQVWLDGRNIKTFHPAAKLVPK
jgi:hypothetical protein